jgi:hypothetical protein
LEGVHSDHHRVDCGGCADEGAAPAVVVRLRIRVKVR